MEPIRGLTPRVLCCARFRDEIFDQIIFLSTIEHIGIPFHNYNIKESDELGDIRAISEIRRVLKKGGTVIVTLPYNNEIKNKSIGFTRNRAFII